MGELGRCLLVSLYYYFLTDQNKKHLTLITIKSNNMAKQVIKNASNLTIEDYIYQVETRPIFAGSDVMASDIGRTQVISIEPGPDKDFSKRTINKKHVVSLEGKFSYGVNDVIFEQEDAIVVWNKNLDENAKLAKKLIEDAKKKLAKAEEDLKTITEIQKKAMKAADTGKLNYDKEGKFIDILITKE